MDEREVVRLYVDEDLSLRQVAARLGTNHHLVRRILERHGVAVVQKHRPRTFTESHRQRLSEAGKGRVPWNEGLTMSEDSRRKNMAAKMGTAIDLSRYPDLARLLILTRLQAKHRAHLAPDDATRQAFLDRFYHDAAFNAVYDAWIASGKDRWFYPSLDHKHPKASGADWTLENLQFLTWFENRAKADMTVEEWEAFRQTTNTRSDLFIEAILGSRRENDSARGT